MKGFINRHIRNGSNSRHSSKSDRNPKVKQKERQQHQHEHQHYHQKRKVKLKNNDKGKERSFRMGLENKLELKLTMRKPYERWKRGIKETLTPLKTNCIFNITNTAELKCTNRTLINNHFKSHHSNNNSSGNSSSISSISSNISNCIKTLKHYLVQPCPENQTAITKTNTNDPFESPITRVTTTSQNIKNSYRLKSTTKYLSLNIKKHSLTTISSLTTTAATTITIDKTYT